MLAIVLICLGIMSRLLPHVAQFTAVLAVSMFAGMFLSRRQALVIPLCVMVVTDVILGFHDTMVYTWGSMALIAGLGMWLKPRKSVMNVLGGSLASALIFFVITNLGAWPTLYPMTLAGLQQCFIMAIPFFRMTVLSTVVYSLVLYVGYEWLLVRSQGKAWARVL